MEVSSSGHATRREWIELSAGDDKYLDIRLEPRPTPSSASSGAVSGKSFTNSLDMEFVSIKPGTFMMGSPSSEKDRYSDESLHEVTLSKGYYLQTTEVTQGQWQAVMGNNRSRFKSCGENCPVVNVSWDDVQEFIQRLNRLESNRKYRLPTEAEWEYAARAGTTTPFSFGDTLSTDQANYNGNYPYGNGPKGICNHAGNLFLRKYATGRPSCGIMCSKLQKLHFRSLFLQKLKS